MSEDSQTSNSVLLVRPASFGFHAEAAPSNAFASARPMPIGRGLGASSTAWSKRSSRARRRGARARRCGRPRQARRDLPQQLGVVPRRRDVVLYPMATAARRLERNVDGLRALLKADRASTCGGSSTSTFHERARPFPRRHREPDPRPPAAAAPTPASARAPTRASSPISTTSSIIRPWCSTPRDRAGQADLPHQRAAQPRHALRGALHGAVAPEYRDGADAPRSRPSGRTLIEVDYEQMRRFACNLIELKGPRPRPVIALSSAARGASAPTSSACSKASASWSTRTSRPSRRSAAAASAA